MRATIYNCPQPHILRLVDKKGNVTVSYHSTRTKARMAAQDAGAASGREYEGIESLVPLIDGV